MVNVLVIIAAILLGLWLLGLVIHFLGGLVHILLVVALVLAIIWFAQRIKFRPHRR